MGILTYIKGGIRFAETFIATAWSYVINTINRLLYMIRISHTLHGRGGAVCFGVVHPFLSSLQFTSTTPHCPTSNLCGSGGPFPTDAPAIPSRASQLPLTFPSGTDIRFTAWTLMGLPWVMDRTFPTVCFLSSQFLSLLTPNSLGTPHIGIAETFIDFLLPCRLHSASTKYSFN